LSPVIAKSFISARFWTHFSLIDVNTAVIFIECSGFELVSDVWSRTDSDRLNLENVPGKTPGTLQKYSAHAVALHVEDAWGEEFVENLVALLQLDQAYSRRQSKLALNKNGYELNLRPRK
jgi:hypothetical protein